ncbi:MAG: matrixin family metalloprotease [Pseudonocardia sp.]
MGILDRLAARRRYRRMARRLAELDRIDRRYGVGAPVPPRVRSGPNPWWARSGFVTVVVVGIVVGLVSFGAPRVIGDGPEARARGYPAVPEDAASARLLPSVVASTTGPHAFSALLPDGTPVTHDPCRPLRYVVNPAGMPPGALEVLRDGVRQISAASGLVILEEGLSTEAAVENRLPVQPDRYGERWAPVLVSWADPGMFPLVDGDIAGVALSHSVSPSGPGSARYVSGQVVFDRGFVAEVLADPRTAPLARTVVLHELGHLVGLDHVAAPGEVMDAASEASELGPGDRQGLAALGAGACRSDT